MAMINNSDAPRTSIFGKYLAKPLSYFIFILWTVLTIAPLVWMIYSSFKTNEELTKSIYAPPHDLVSVRNAKFDVVKPQTNILYPKGFLKKLGISSSKYTDQINEKVLILESPNIGAHKRIKVHFLVRAEIPDSCVTSD